MSKYSNTNILFNLIKTYMVSIEMAYNAELTRTFI